jgi:hypothetical protein
MSGLFYEWKYRLQDYHAQEIDPAESGAGLTELHHGFLHCFFVNAVKYGLNMLYAGVFRLTNPFYVVSIVGKKTAESER